MITFEEFKKAIYYTEKSLILPWLSFRLNKVDYMKNGKMDLIKLEEKLEEIYKLNINKFKNG